LRFRNGGLRVYSIGQRKTAPDPAVKPTKVGRTDGGLTVQHWLVSLAAPQSHWALSDPKLKSTTDGYPVVHSNDGAIGIQGCKLPDNPQYPPVKIPI